MKNGWTKDNHSSSRDAEFYDDMRKKLVQRARIAMLTRIIVYAWIIGCACVFFWWAFGAVS